jgi:hypothetical protein
MHIAMRNALTFGRNDFRLLLSDFTVSGAVWLLVGFFLAIAALSMLAIEATLVFHAPDRRQFRARCTPEVAKSTTSEMRVEGMLN